MSFDYAPNMNISVVCILNYIYICTCVGSGVASACACQAMFDHWFFRLARLAWEPCRLDGLHWLGAVLPVKTHKHWCLTHTPRFVSWSGNWKRRRYLWHYFMLPGLSTPVCWLAFVVFNFVFQPATSSLVAGRRVCWPSFLFLNQVPKFLNRRFSVGASF